MKVSSRKSATSKKTKWSSKQSKKLNNGSKSTSNSCSSTTNCPKANKNNNNTKKNKNKESSKSNRSDSKPKRRATSWWKWRSTRRVTRTTRMMILCESEWRYVNWGHCPEDPPRLSWCHHGSGTLCAKRPKHGSLFSHILSRDYFYLQMGLTVASLTRSRCTTIHHLRLRLSVCLMELGRVRGFRGCRWFLLGLQPCRQRIWSWLGLGAGD